MVNSRLCGPTENRNGLEEMMLAGRKRQYRWATPHHRDVLFKGDTLHFSTLIDAESRCLNDA